MKNIKNAYSHSLPGSGGAVARATAGVQDDSALPSLTSGFGAVIEKERELRNATDDSCGHVTGNHTLQVDRLLQRQHSRLGANIALLEQRYESLPNPERFAIWHGRRGPPTTARKVVEREEVDLLTELIARHRGLVSDIAALISRAPDGQRGEVILTEVGRNHEQMAVMLTALLNDDASIARSLRDAVARPGGTNRAQQNWENEGGRRAARE